MRRSGKRTSTVTHKSDLLSLFFESPDVFTDEFIVDELMDFFAAATKTTMNATQTIVGHFCTDKQSLQKVRNEFEQVIKESGEWNPDDVKLSRKDFLTKYVKFDNINE